MGCLKFIPSTRTSIRPSTMARHILKPLQLEFAQEIKIGALRRSGQHAVINWIAKQAAGDLAFVNNVGDTRNISWTDCYKDGKRLCSRASVSVLKNRKLDVLMYNIENGTLPEIAEAGLSSKPITVLVMRDVYNWLSSRIAGVKADHFSILEGYRDVRVWKEYAREYLGQTAMMKDVVFVKYNDWFSSPEYRCDLSEKLGLGRFDPEAGVNEVATAGCGSSFDGLTYGGNAQGMDVLGRYKNMRTHPWFKELVESDEELVELNFSLFPAIGRI